MLIWYFTLYIFYCFLTVLYINVSLRLCHLYLHLVLSEEEIRFLEELGRSLLDITGFEDWNRKWIREKSKKQVNFHMKKLVNHYFSANYTVH